MASTPIAPYDARALQRCALRGVRVLVRRATSIPLIALLGRPARGRKGFSTSQNDLRDRLARDRQACSSLASSPHATVFHDPPTSSMAAPRALVRRLVSTRPVHHAPAAQLGVDHSPLGARHQRYELHLPLVIATGAALVDEPRHLLNQRPLRHHPIDRQHYQSWGRCQSRQLPDFLGLIAWRHW